MNLITKDGNYGWRAYEGPNPYNPPKAPGGNTSRNSISPIFPVMGYSHSDVNKNEGSASITGGYFYRSTTDPCLQGRSVKDFNIKRSVAFSTEILHFLY